MHLHGLNLGLPGNGATTLETLKALDGHRAHLAHIQFHSYGGDAPTRRASFDSQVAALAEYVNAHRELTVDVGQVLFGETTSMTADGPVGQYLHAGDGPEVGQPRRRAGDRLRRRADHVRGQELRPRPAMGDRPGVVPPRRTTPGGSP